MQSNQQPNHSDGETGLTLVLFIAQSWSFVFHVILHRRTGLRFIGFQGVGAFVLFLFYPIFWSGYSLVGLGCFFCLFVVAFLTSRFSILGRCLASPEVHSRYDGTPIFWIPDGGISEFAFKQWIEPTILVGIGLLTSTVDAPLGWFLVWGGISMFLIYIVMSKIQRDEFLDLHDAMCSQRRVANRLSRSRR
jgi:hypothetical protein